MCVYVRVGCVSMCLSGVSLCVCPVCMCLSGVYPVPVCMCLSGVYLMCSSCACALSLSLFRLEDARRGVHVDKASLPFGYLVSFDTIRSLLTR